MCDHLDILNLHLRLWDTYIFSWMSGLHYAGEGRRLCAVTHLALARRQNSRTGILGQLRKTKAAF